MRDQPKWSRGVEFNWELERLAIQGRLTAAKLRCEALESGGWRCTADAKPLHEHRYNEEDLPRTTDGFRTESL